MNINVNKGMYLEQIINRTINYYSLHKICYLEKRQLPLQIISKKNNNIVIAKLLKKSYVDYFGCYNGKHIEFECKQTSNDYFDLNVLKKHQIEYLINLNNNGAYSYLMIYFEQFDYFLFINVLDLLKCFEKNQRKQLPFNLIKNYGKEVKIEYPGIINFIKNVM